MKNAHSSQRANRRRAKQEFPAPAPSKSGPKNVIINVSVFTIGSVEF
jgi:hypothetical protein